MSPVVSSYARSGGAPEGCEEEWIGNVKQCLQCCLFIYTHCLINPKSKISVVAKEAPACRSASLIDFPHCSYLFLKGICTVWNGLESMMKTL